jgi:hypothetical protein
VKILIKQLLLLVAVTSAITFLLASFGINIAISVAISLILQFAVYNGFNYIVDSFTITRIRKIEYEKIRELSYQTAEIACACSPSHIQLVPIRLNTDNQYTCDSCKKLIKVYVNFETALATEPIIETNPEKLFKTKIDDTK